VALADAAVAVNRDLQRMMAERIAQQEMARKAQLEQMAAERASRAIAVQEGQLNLGARRFDAEQAANSEQQGFLRTILTPQSPDPTESDPGPHLPVAPIDDMVNTPSGRGRLLMAGLQPSAVTPPARTMEAQQGPTLGTFEDYVVRRFGENPSADQLAQAKDAWAEAGRAEPQGSTARTWVLRNGQALRVAEPEIRPGDQPYSASAMSGGSGSRTLPARVQGFLLDLRARHASYDAALRELQQVLATAPDETFDRIATAQELRGLYAQPTGRAGLFGDLDLSGAGSLLGDAPAAAPQYRPGQVVTLRDGTTATITRVLPDGRYEVE